MSLKQIKEDVLKVIEIQVKKDWWPLEIEWRTEGAGEAESQECVLLDAATEEELIKGNHTWRVRIGLQLRANAIDRDKNEFAQMSDVISLVLERLSASDFKGMTDWHCYRIALQDQSPVGNEENLYIATWSLSAVVQF